MSVDREAAVNTLTEVQESFAKGRAPETEAAARSNLEGRRALRPKATRLAVNIVLVVGSVLFSLAVLEAGVRLLRSGPQGLVQWVNLPRERMGIAEDGTGTCAYAYDQTLGWTLPPNCASARYNIDANGFRRTPATASLAEPPVLVTGSSFALGEEVADGESWPAYLQNLIGRRVVNAAVSGYALDQAVLMTERVVPRVKPLVVILSFTPGDIMRTELKVAWSREKPYFAVKDGRLELGNVPVPGRPKPGRTSAVVPMPVAARLLGWSVLADQVVQRLGIQKGWYFDEVQAPPPGTGETISCLLMPRLAALGVPVAVLAEYSRGYWTNPDRDTRDVRAIRKVLGCAAEAGLVAIDLYDQLKPAVEARGIDALFRLDHHTAQGNRVVADLLMHELVRRRLLPQTADR